MTRFVHLTDLHVTDPGRDDPKLLSDTPAMLRRVVAEIGRMDPAPDFVAISGDLTNHGDVESYGCVKAALEPLAMPVVVSLGNHDARDGFRAVFDPDAQGDATPAFHHRVLAGLHVIALDSSVPGRVGGAIGVDQFDHLDAALAAHPDLPKLILCHHPPAMPQGAGLAWESLTPEDSVALAARLAAQNVIAVLSGHMHCNRVLHWHGIPVVISTGLHNTVDMLEPADMVMEEGAGLAIGQVLPDALDIRFVPLAPRGAVLGRIGAERLRGFS